MAETVITDIDQVTADWLTSVLTASGVLTGGAVASFELAPGQGNWSRSANLTVQYTGGARGLLPKRLFLKMVDADAGDGETFGDSEVTYYLRDYVDAPNAPLLRCYDGAYSPELNRYHLLLDDVSETHVEAADKQPTLEYGLALAEGLAALHARWWGARRLAQAGAGMHSPEHTQRFIDIAEPGVERILRHFSDRLAPHWPQLLREVFEKVPPALIRRCADPNGFTLIHGDVGCSNVLAPRNGDRPIYIIDRQPFNWSLTTWLGAYDLAYAIILDWDVDSRRQCEMAVLKRYHEHLILNGVNGYTWERLYDDYRLCAALCVTIPVEYCRGGVIERYVPVWLPMLQRSLAACDDLGCRELW